jgi:hypothetical protein
MPEGEESEPSEGDAAPTDPEDPEADVDESAAPSKAKPKEDGAPTPATL